MGTAEAQSALDEARDRFYRSIADCRNLIAIHEARNSGQGRRYQELALNRATIVLAVATWQALVQDVTLAGLENAEPQPGAPDRGTYELLAASIRKGVQDFATPNAAKSRALLATVGLDVKDHWAWEVGARNRPIDFGEVIETLDGWLAVRHAIAHGHKEMPRRRVLEAIEARYKKDIKAGKDPKVKTYPDPTIRKSDAMACTAFIHDLAWTTAAAMAEHCGCEAAGWSEFQWDT
ncbi:hypothetical protein [Tsukamurella pulmonis]|uniref:hypothetical protein n=1 Tax=Tsukamurella pulmonis TaxID=47312 RepID=UPI000E09C5B9|nr:hypothetical protein [Tsukamurella pulmonis]RDH13677.1 hypothetical protein DVB88_01195 [Tsukamurella pulmonis]